MLLFLGTARKIKKYYAVDRQGTIGPVDVTDVEIIQPSEDSKEKGKEVDDPPVKAVALYDCPSWPEASNLAIDAGETTFFCCTKQHTHPLSTLCRGSP